MLYLNGIVSTRYGIGNNNVLLAFYLKNKLSRVTYNRYISSGILRNNVAVSFYIVSSTLQSFVRHWQYSSSFSATESIETISFEMFTYLLSPLISEGNTRYRVDEIWAFEMSSGSLL